MANLHVVPDNVSTENAAFAEPLAAAFRIVEQELIGANDKVAIVGDGKLGILIAEVVGRHVANAGGATKPILFGRHTSKMSLVSAAASIETGMAEQALPARAGSFDVVIDATGSPAGLDLARALCRPLGTLILKSTCAAGTDFNTAPFVVDELKIIGSRCGPFPPALELLASGSTRAAHQRHLPLRGVGSRRQGCNQGHDECSCACRLNEYKMLKPQWTFLSSRVLDVCAIDDV